MSEAELEVLKVLWRLSPCTAREVRELLQEEGRDWAYNTVKTLLDRLVQKEMAARDSSGFAHRFRAKVARETLAGRYVGKLVRDLGAGSAMAMARALTGGAKVDRAELERLAGMIERLREAEDDP